MAADEGLSWAEQLKTVREQVIEREQQRELEKRLVHERNEASIRERLKEDTPEALNTRFNEVRKVSDRAARKFYPLPHLEAVLKDIQELGGILRFYADCQKQFGNLFSPVHRTTIKTLLGELGDLQRGLDRQIGQWSEIKPIIEGTTFRALRPADNEAVVAAAKSFSSVAHNVPLSVPGDFFAHEGANFFIAEYAGQILGYVKFWPEEKAVTLALVAPGKVNFKKFIRGLLHRFYTVALPVGTSDVVRVKIGFVREVKFFTDMGFVRAETKGPSDWIYSRELD